jgi:predicted enzyme related to lactoylglutathione lyase
MAKIINIGGVFIYAQSPELLAAWYELHLGFSFKRMAEEDLLPTFYQVLSCRDLDNPGIKLQTVFSIMPARQELSALRNQVMINYRVDDLDTFVKQLSDAGIAVDPVDTWADGEGMGKFTHLYDPEGNRIELWQHIQE